MTRASHIALAMVIAGCMSSRFEESGGDDGSGGGGSGSTGETTPSTSSGADSSSGDGSAGATSDDPATSGDASTSTGDDVDVPPGFLQDPDNGRTSFECSTYEQDCPPGEKCNWWADDRGNAWNATRCVPIDPDPDDVGEACTVVGSGASGVDSCDLGLMCWSVDPDTGIGTCVAQCLGSESGPLCPHAGEVCSIGSSGLALCLAGCDPLAQDCAEGEACVAFDAFSCVPDASGSSGAAGDPCEFVNTCDPGLACVDADMLADCPGFGCCSPFCDLEDPSCPAELECVAYFDPAHAPWGYEDVGQCAQP